MIQGNRDGFEQQNVYVDRLPIGNYRNNITPQKYNQVDFYSHRISHPFPMNRQNDVNELKYSQQPKNLIIQQPNAQYQYQSPSVVQFIQSPQAQDNNFQIQQRDQRIQQLIQQLDAISNNSRKEAAASQHKLKEYENYIEVLENENRNLQQELSEISNHLTSHKDHFDNFQKFDQKSNKETNEYLCNQIERLTEMLGLKNLENQELQQQIAQQKMIISEPQGNQSYDDMESKIQSQQVQLDQYKQMLTAHQLGQEYVKGLKDRSNKLQMECQTLNDQVRNANEQEQYWKKLYNEQRYPQNGYQKQDNLLQDLGLGFLDSALKNQEQRKNGFDAMPRSDATPKTDSTPRTDVYMPRSESTYNLSTQPPKTTKAKLQWKQQINN